MKTSKILKLKFYYLINKNTIISFIVYLVLIIFPLIIDILSIDKTRPDLEIKNEYIINSFLYIKIFSVFFNVYMYSSIVNFKNDFLVYLLIPLNVRKEKSILISILLNNLIFLFLYIIIFIAFSYLGLFINSFYIDEDIIISFINIYFISLIFGLYSMILSQVFKESLSMVVMMAAFIASNNLMEYKDKVIIKICSLIIPFTDGSGLYLFGFYYLIILFIFLCVVNVVIYHFRDLNF